MKWNKTYNVNVLRIPILMLFQVAIISKQGYSISNVTIIASSRLFPYTF